MMGDMGRPKNNDFPAYMSPDGDRGGFIVRNPLSGKKKRFRADQEQEARATAAALVLFIEKRKQRLLIEAGRPSLRTLIARWKAEKLAFQPWDESTRKTFLMRLDRIDREKGGEIVELIDCLMIEAWLTQTASRPDPFNKWRHAWIVLLRFAVSQKLARTNEAEKVERRSTSRKVESNRKVRQQLDIQGFRDIHEKAEPFLKLAMELALVTAQSRKEVCNFKHADFRNGYLFVIRDKVSADSDMAFIRIELTAELEALRARALLLDNIVSPFLVHRRPERMQRRWMDGKSHWTYVNGQYLTRAFAKARDKIERFAALPERQRPTFHEIRGLAGRQLRRLGVSKNKIKDLMTHSDERTTEIYLELGAEALTDDHYLAVAAPFTVSEMLSAK